ncbi:MAG: heparan-alpha-glucosaminide N-acetyltransferase domain-containing protein [Gemmatimonadaceae bacterium]
MTPTRPRLDALDVLRGIVMIIMMIDHTRDFVNAQNFQFDPTDVTRTTVPLFFTRWITHFCAPLFVFLAGTSIYLQKMRGKSGLSSFLIKRGIWLVVLELTLLKVVIWFNLAGTFTWLLQVIWVIGIGMIVMAGLVRLPTWVSGVAGAGMIALHNLTDGIRTPGWAGPTGRDLSAGGKLWILLHQGGPMPIASSAGPVVLVLYSLIPWVGVVAAGYAFGRIYELDWERRRKLLVQIGTGCVLAFLTLRLANIYGDPSRWASQPTTAMTIVSFFNVSKYPASLLFLLMTIGPGLLALAAFEGWRAESRIKAFFMTFGRVPLFYYMLQWIWAHGMAVVLAAVTGKEVAYLFRGLPDMYTGAPRDAGFSLVITWLVWLVGVFALYPLCKWYAGVKARRKDWWISYT